MIARRIKLTALAATLSLAVSACGGGGGGGGTPATPTPTATPTSVAGFACPSSTSDVAGRTSGVVTSAVMRRRYVGPRAASKSDTLLAVSYDDRANIERQLESRASQLGAQSAGRFHFDRIGRTVRVFRTDAASLQTVKAQLKTIPGIASVSEVHRVYPQTRGATLTNDPYFKGASGTSPPLYQTTNTGGQWDMHIVQLEHAFSYSEGSTSVKLAIIDTGEDVTHPDLKSANIVRTGCFITDTNGVQSTGTFVTDPDGHGTDVTGIAAEGTNNGFGFAGDAGNVSLMLYRVFPTPVDECATNPKSTNPHCGSVTLDIASAINDAVANGANVISMSLGDTTNNCTSGTDPDSTEGAAVANAIAHNVIVVAASGNAGNGTVAPPGCDTGVIAVGASAYNDGNPNGSGFTGTRAEYVPSYSDWGSTNSLRNPSSWGIVAPGGDGDPNSTQTYYLHWIENIWTTTPLDDSFKGQCKS